jgi:hypothetical protein
MSLPEEHRDERWRAEQTFGPIHHDHGTRACARKVLVSSLTSAAGRATNYLDVVSIRWLECLERGRLS